MTTSAHHFSLASRSLKLDTAEHVAPHVESLTSGQAAHHTSLDLSGNTLGVSACEHLATVLKTQTALESINLADIFTARLLSEIPPALSSLLDALLPLQHLHTIDLSDNAFGLNTVGPLVTFLSQHLPLRHLILQNNGLGPFAGTQVADALTTLAGKKAEARRKYPKADIPELETVICGRNRLESGSMPAWAKMCQANQGLKIVKMVQNGIRQDGIALLLKDGLGPGCKRLEVLDLQDNTFTFTASQALASVVSDWTHLRELGVGECLVGARGAVILGNKLAEGANKQLEILRAQYNEIDVKGVQALHVAAQKGLPALRRIELNGNKFSEDDEAVEGLRTLLVKRKEDMAQGPSGGVADGEWGLDELSDMEEDSDDDEEDDVGDNADEEEEEEDEFEATKVENEAKRETILKDADDLENQNVSQEKDGDVDALADVLDKTHVA